MALFALLLPLWTSCDAPVDDPPPPTHAGVRVLFIASFHPAFPTFDGQLGGIRSVLEPRGITVDIEFLDARRFSSAEQQSRIADALARKLEAMEPYAAIIVADDAALQFCRRYRERVLGDTPVAFCAVNSLDHLPALQADPHVTGVIESLSLAETARLAVRLFPDTRRVLAVVDDTHLGKSLAEQFDALASNWPDEPGATDLRFETLSLTTLDFDRLDAALDQLGDGDVVLQVVAYRDHTGATRTKAEAYRRIMPHVRCPLFTAFALDVGLGPIGGHVISHVEQGKSAAAIAVRMIDGESPADIPVVTVSPNIPMFDHRQLTRFGIRQSALPAESQVLHAPRSFYYENPTLVHGTLIAFAGMLLVLAVVARLNRKLRNTTRKLDERNRQLGITLDSIGDAVVATDTDGRVILMNPVAERLTGWTEADAIGKPMTAVFRTESPSSHGGKATSTEEFVLAARDRVLIARDGKRRQIADTTAPIRDPEGHEFGQVIVFRDMTELLSMEDRLRRSQKLEAVGRLAGGVAHDFNNLLTAIIGHVQLAMHSEVPPSDIRGALDNINHAANSAADLTRQLLTFARRQVLQPEVIAPAAKVDALARMIKPLIADNVQTRLDCRATGKIRMDPGQFEQLLVNLAVNANLAMEDGGGTLTIRVRDVERGVELVVADTGCGMDDETRERAFEPFFTTRGTAGTGLGLATCHGIARQSGGDIWIESVRGRGTEVHVVWPAATRGRTVLLSTDRADDAGSADVPGGHILVVEDDPAVRTVCVNTLTRDGYRVEQADTVAAVRELQPRWSEFDAVISDVVLCDGRGPEVVREVRAAVPQIPVLFVSGYTEDEDVTDLENSAFLPKPYTPDLLLGALRRVMNGASAPRT